MNVIDQINKEVILKSDIQSVWNAISRAEEIQAWFLNTDFKAEVGSSYTFSKSDGSCPPISGTILEADPYTLVYTWIVGDTDVETTVRWHLEEVESGTKLSLQHSGISNYTHETAVEMMAGFNEGWDNCLTGLSSYL